MPRPRKPYPPEFREQIVALARTGRTTAELAAEFQPCEETTRKGIVQAAIDDGIRTDGATSDEKEELRRLRRENKRLKMEREILAKAAVWFARETGKAP